MIDAKEFAEIIREEVARGVKRELESLRVGFEASIKAIPHGQHGKDGRDGIDGKDGAPGSRGDDGEKGDPGEIGPAGPKGDKGDRGEDGAPGMAGKDGAPGDPGKDGKDGEKGADGLNGKDGRDGIDGKDGAPGLHGKDGRDGIDGKSVSLEEMTPLMEAYFSKWALGFEHRAAETLQKTIDRIPVPKDGRDGVNGKDGRDGLDLSSFDVEMLDDDRTLVFALKAGDQKFSREIRLPLIKDAGVYEAGKRYERGDAVSYGGSVFFAKKDTIQGPGTDDWRLAVKRGRDAK